MSAVRTALYARLVSDATLTALLGDGTTGVHHRHAPAGADFPLVIFNRQAGVTEWTVGDSFESELWLVKAVDRSNSATAAEAIDARVQTLLNDHALSVTGHDTMSLRRASAVDFAEQDGDERYEHVGSIYRLNIQAT